MSLDTEYYQCPECDSQEVETLADGVLHCTDCDECGMPVIEEEYHYNGGLCSNCAAEEAREETNKFTVNSKEKRMSK
jgi:ribosomal protein L37AE/L43A